MTRKMKASTILFVCFAVSAAKPAFAQDAADNQTVLVGPWAIATTYKADTFENCTMSRSVDDLNITFQRNEDGLLLSLDSPKWMLEEGEAYTVQLTTGSQEIDAKAMAASKSVTITLSDTELNERLRTANALEVRGEGMTLSVPLDGSAVGLERLDACYEKNLRQSPESNPFVPPAKTP